jgi:hypothetical protein
MNTIARVGIFGAIFLVTGLFSAAWGWVRSPYMTEVRVVKPQPVPFSHAHHVGDIGIDCRYCHTSVEREAFAGMPATEVCMNCHSQLFSDSAMLAPVRESYRDGKPLQWTRVHDAPDYVFFHHGIHVSKGVACERCHGRVDKMPLMWRENTLHMSWCLECHWNPGDNVRPPSDVFVMGWKPGPGTPSQSELVAAGHIRSQTNCSVCHR